MKLRVLVIDPDAEDALFLQEALAEAGSACQWTQWLELEAVHAGDLDEAAHLAASDRPSVILLSASAAGEAIVPAYRNVQAAASEVPVLVLADETNGDSAIQLIRSGVQDVLSKRDLEPRTLAHSILAAVERNRITCTLQASTNLDLLTGVLNSRGFSSMAERDRSLAMRLKLKLLVLFAEPQGLEAPGHGLEAGPEPGSLQRADLRLIETAEFLRRFSDPQDLVGRISYSRFALASLETNPNTIAPVWARIYSAASEAGMAIGAAMFDPAHPVSMEALFEEAMQNFESSPSRGTPQALAMRR